MLMGFYLLHINMTYHAMIFSEEILKKDNTLTLCVNRYFLYS